ncbi:MAG: iron-sulfur cluster assembly accessory protein [Rhodospirillaceae bacterium]
MMALTDSAVTALRRVIDGAEPPPAGLRIMVEDGGCSGYRYTMGLDSAVLDTDTVWDVGGITLLVDAGSRSALEGVRVDFVDGPEGAGFVIENPNARLGCGSCNSQTC